ncbi:MAG: DUF47 family protein [Proteobacteria bacterium]|nr:DUF47 family protein [Pseudomonadota bacterium]
MKRLLPKQDNFFELFEQAAYQLESATEHFVQLVRDLPKANEYAKLIAEHEATADNYARATFDLLHKAFITPFDRHDIHRLTRKLDDILDIINRTTRRIVLYHFKLLPSGIIEIADLAYQAVHAVKKALSQIKNLKNAPSIIQLCNQISEYDGRAEQIMLQGVDKLFSDEQDIKYLLKAKEIFDYSTAILQECHDVADIIKGIVLEYS